MLRYAIAAATLGCLLSWAIPSNSATQNECDDTDSCFPGYSVGGPQYANVTTVDAGAKEGSCHCVGGDFGEDAQDRLLTTRRRWGSPTGNVGERPTRIA